MSFNKLIQFNHYSKKAIGLDDTAKKINSGEYNFDTNFFVSKTIYDNNHIDFNLLRRSFVHNTSLDNEEGFIKLETTRADDNKFQIKTIDGKLIGDSVSENPAIVFRQTVTLESYRPYWFCFNGFVQRRQDNTFPVVKLKVYDYNKFETNGGVQTSYELIGASSALNNRNSTFEMTSRYYTNYINLSQYQHNGAKLGTLELPNSYNEDDDDVYVYYRNDTNEDKEVLVALEFDGNYQAGDNVYLRYFEMAENDITLDSATITNALINHLYCSTLVVYRSTTMVGAVQMSTTADITGAVRMFSTLNVTGSVSMTSTLNVGSTVTMASNLNVTGSVSMTSTLNVGKNISTTGGLYQYGNLILDSTPVGALMPYAGNATPNGWLFCSGQAVSRSTYSELFANIGITYGNGDGVNTFNLPNLCGRVVVGIGQGAGLTNRTLGAAGGAETHTLTIAEMPSHDHTGFTGFAGWAAATVNPAVSLTTTDVADDNGTHRHTIPAEGGGQAHNNMQPFLALSYIIKYSNNYYLNSQHN